MSKKRVLSLFSGCGGMDLGFEGGFEVFKKSINQGINKNWITKTKGKKVLLENNNFETVFANDIFQSARSAWLKYFSQRHKNASEIFHPESIVDLVKLHIDKENIFPEEIDVVTGGFPCQDFSLSGRRGGFKSHKNHNGEVTKDIPTEENRGLLYIWMKEVIKITKPKIFIAENVKGLISLGDVKQIIEEDFRQIDKGYIVLPAQILHAADYGVPQNRERVIFIGISKRYLNPKIKRELNKKTIRPEINPYPNKTHSYTEQAKHLSKVVTVKDVLGDLSEPDDEITKDEAQKKYSKAKYYGKMQGSTEVNLNGIGPTIRSEHHGNIEFRRLSKKHGGKLEEELNSGLPERRLSVRECARIQTFPDDYSFVFRDNKEMYLSASGAYKVIGNAVPPMLAYNIAKRIESIWNIYFESST